MRKVIIKKANQPRYDVAEGTRGVLLTWGVEASEGGGSTTIAIVELEDGSVVETFPTFIQFSEPIMLQLAATPAGIARACGMENEVESAQEVSATKPPKGWALMVDGDRKRGGYIIFEAGAWHYGSRDCIGEIVTGYQLASHPCANPLEAWV